MIYYYPIALHVWFKGNFYNKDEQDKVLTYLYK